MKIQGINSVDNYNRNKIKKTSFKRNWEEHISWGANYIKSTEKTNFKLFSFPDAKSVFVEVADKFANFSSDIKQRKVNVIGTVGSVLAINEIIPKDDETRIYKMDKQEDGIFVAKDISANLEDKYRYIVVDKDNNINLVKDPYSKKQESINGWSSVYNKDNYIWENTGWFKGEDSRRIIRKKDEPLRGLENLIIEEVNIPTLTPEGSFQAAKSSIDKIAAKNVATAIEIMPVENTFSLQWGYDGVDKFAVNEKLGGAEGLKSFVDYAHGKGLNVIMDMVPNHMGPDGDSLSKTGPYEKGYGPFGGELNYEGKDNKYVRDWMTNAALWWVNEFKVDGLRLDMTKFCNSDYLLKQIVTEVNEHNPEVFIIAEDGRENLPSVTKYEDKFVNHNDALNFIDTQVDFIAKNRGWNSNPSKIGFDSEWDFRLMHTLKNALLSSGSYLLDEVDDKIKNSEYRVKYVMSHDEIGNEDGTRLIPKVIVSFLNLFMQIRGSNDVEKGQKAAQAGQKFAELVVSDYFPIMSEDELMQYEKNLGIINFVPKVDIVNAFNTAIAKQKLALGTILTLPGPKMYFQGDDVADLSYFKFFRDFSYEKQARKHSDEMKNKIVSQKGYDTLESEARPDSILGNVKIEGRYVDLPNQMNAFISNLKKVINEFSVLQKGKIVGTYKDTNHNIHVHQLKLGNEEILVMKNFGKGFHIKNYFYPGFPADKQWKEIFNSDDIAYGGSGYINKGREFTDIYNNGLSIAPNSFIIMKKIS